MDYNPTRGDSSWAPHQQLQDCGSATRRRCNQNNRRKTYCCHNRPRAKPAQAAGFAIGKIAPGSEAYSSACRPNGPTVNSQGCKPLVRMWNNNVKAPTGRQYLSPRWGFDYSKESIPGAFAPGY